MKFKEHCFCKLSIVSNVFRSLRYKNYRLFFVGQGISLVGTWIQRIAMPWLVYHLTGSAFLLGLVGFVGQIPTFLLASFAGVLTDRYDKYYILIILHRRNLHVIYVVLFYM